MLLLFAHSPRDGWALVRSGLFLHLLPPPYLEPEGSGLDQREALRVIESGGFQITEQSFADWPTLFDHLRAVRLAAVGGLSEEEAQVIARKVLARASPARLAHFIDSAECILDAGQREDATRLLGELVILPRVIQDATLRARIDTLLARAAANPDV